MSEKQHTPGPWEWTGGKYALNGADGATVLEACEGTVYSEYSCDSAYVDCKPEDANLIAAAPDLLVALMHAAPNHHYSQVESGWCSGKFDSCQGQSCRAARAAIAKAKGHAP